MDRRAVMKQAPASGKRTTLSVHLLRVLGACALAALSLTASSGLARAGPTEGYRALEAGDYGAAEAAFRPLAEAGDARAQMALGVIADLKSEREAAMAWYKRAGEQGLSEAQVLLGATHLSNGDLLAAHCWIAQAAERKHPKADALLQSIAARLSPEELARAQALLDEGCP